MTQDHIDRVQAFLDSLQKMGEQLKTAEEQQCFYLRRMLDLKREQQTDSQEYADLDVKSKALQQLIDKNFPIYQERVKMMREAMPMPRRKRTKNR
jgi:hypothetical protein